MDTTETSPAPTLVRERARLYPRVTSFRSRRGTLTPAQQRNWDALWPTLGAEATTDAAPLNLSAWFGRTAPVICEIGCGTGISTAAMARREPEFDVLAVEVYQPGMAQLLGAIGRERIDNIRLIRGDAVVVARDMLGPASLTGIRIFFPDPWPKARHHKRRLVQSGTLALLADRLVDGGVLHVATDHAGYAEWIADELAASPLFAPVQGPAPFSLDRPTTKFEGRAERDGRAISEFVRRRVSRPSEPFTGGEPR